MKNDSFIRMGLLTTFFLLPPYSIYSENVIDTLRGAAATVSDAISYTGTIYSEELKTLVTFTKAGDCYPYGGIFLDEQVAGAISQTTVDAIGTLTFIAGMFFAYKGGRVAIRAFIDKNPRFIKFLIGTSSFLTGIALTKTGYSILQSDPSSVRNLLRYCAIPSDIVLSQIRK